MIPVRQLARATFSTPDLSRSVDYFRDLTGLTVVASSPSAAFFATEVGLVCHEIQKGASADLVRLGLQIGIDLETAARLLSDLRIASKSFSDPSPGVRKSLRFQDPCGTEIELFEEVDFVEPSFAGGGVRPLKLGHVARFCSDLPKQLIFYRDVLGFRVSDWVGDYFVFLRCNSDHHAINFFAGPSNKLHHMALEMKDMAHLQSACDVLARFRVPIGWGPLRQSAGHNMAVYHRNDDGHVVEYYCELDQMKDEGLGYFDPRPWHTDRPQRPKTWDPSTWEAGWGTPPAPHFRRTSKGAEAE